MPPKQRIVSIQSHFCPLCYRGGARSEKVASNSQRIDEEQRECSRLFRGLPLLDLESEGSICSKPCRLVCLVCGSAMAFPCEPCFEEAQEVVERYEENETETRIEVLEQMKCLSNLGTRMLQELEGKFFRRLRKMGMAWHPRWKRLVHAHCIRKAPCDCLLPVGINFCSTHKRTVIPKKRNMVQKTLVETKPETKPDTPVPHKPARGSSQIAIVRATWLNTPTTTVSIPVTVVPRSSVPQPLLLKSKLIPPKKNLRLEHAASGCSKLDSWMGAKPVNVPGEVSRNTFNLQRHYQLFDPMLHGYVSINGVDMYRFPHGPVVQVFSPVNTLTDDGRLIPS
jgi:hypothetical protein